MSLREAVGTQEGAALVEVDGVQLAVSREGHGPPLVCLHAIAHGARDFEPLARAVRDRFEVICIDWPGHGRSGADREPASAARYAALLVGVLDAARRRAPARDWQLHRWCGRAALR